MYKFQNADTMTFLGNYIERKRLEKGWSYRDLEDESGVPFGTIQDIESGKTKEPGIIKVFKIAKALNISPTALMYAIDDVDPDTIPGIEKEVEKDILLDSLQKLIDSQRKPQK